MRIKKIMFMMAIVFATILSFTSCSKVEAGYVGVKVDLLGSDKGVQNEVLGTGRYWIGVNEELFIFPTYQVNYVYTRDVTEGSESNEEFTFQTKEGMICSADLGLSMHFEREKISEMFQKYRKGEDEIRGVVVRKEIRDALNRVSSGMNVEYVYGEGKGKLIDSVKVIVKRKLLPSGIVIDDLNLISAIRIPQSIEEALNMKVKMTQDAQKAQNEVAKATAEANIATAKAQGEADAMKIKADGEAYYNRTVSGSLTPQIVEMKRLEKWDGAYPTTYGVNGGLLIK
jgi:regulator of protease activity HflC (stomatin/prohibitin superfamily)